MAAVRGDTKNNRFLVGTSSLNANNEVHLIEYHEDENDVFCCEVFPHQHEVWSINPHPTKAKYFFTIYNTVKSGFEAALHGMGCYSESSTNEEATSPKDSSPVVSPGGTEQKSTNIETYAKLDAKQFDNERLHEILWEPNGSDRIITIDDKSLREFRLDQINTKNNCKFVTKYEMGGRRLRTGAWDPHHSELVAIGAQNKVIQVDLREKNTKKNVEFMAHDQMVRDVEYNPYQNYRLATCGDDCMVKFWDLRNTKDPVLVLCGHSHWISKVTFNPSYDQLVLSCGTDSKVNLWSLASISSKVKEKELDNENEGGESSPVLSSSKRDDSLFNSLVHTYDEHEESVYSVCWSSVNSWTFGSVSYDGRVLIHTVPKSEKLRILKID